MIDLVYNIQEGEPYLLGHLIIRGNDRTRDRVLRREAEMAGLVPGEPINAKRIEMYQKRLQNLQLLRRAARPGQADRDQAGQPPAAQPALRRTAPARYPGGGAEPGFRIPAKDSLTAP